MAKITIDGQEYDTETFSEKAMGQLGSLQVVDRKISDMNNDLLILQTARSVYAKNLGELLPPK